MEIGFLDYFTAGLVGVSESGMLRLCYTLPSPLMVVVDRLW